MKHRLGAVVILAAMMGVLLPPSTALGTSAFCYPGRSQDSTIRKVGLKINTTSSFDGLGAVLRSNESQYVAGISYDYFYLYMAVSDTEQAGSVWFGWFYQYDSRSAQYSIEWKAQYYDQYGDFTADEGGYTTASIGDSYFEIDRGAGVFQFYLDSNLVDSFYAPLGTFTPKEVAIIGRTNNQANEFTGRPSIKEEAFSPIYHLTGAGSWSQFNSGRSLIDTSRGLASVNGDSQGNTTVWDNACT